MKLLLVILAFLVMSVIGGFASMSKRYMRVLAFCLAIPMLKWPSFALMLFSEEFYRGSSRGMEISLTYLLAFALLVALALRRSTGKLFADGGSLLFIVYWLLTMPSLVNCQNMLYAWFEIWKGLMMFLVYRAVRGYCLHTRDYVTPLLGLTVVAVANFLCVFYQHFFVHVNQAHGLFAHQNSMAMWTVLAGAIFYSAYLNMKVSRLWRLFAFCFVCAGIACFRTYSRGSMMMFPFALGIVSLISFVRNFHLQMLSRLTLLAAIFALGLALAFPKIINRFTAAPSNSARMRVVFAEAAMRMVEDHPWAGVGLNNWGIYINPPFPYSQHRDEFRMSEDYKDGIVETVYLLTWAECGTPCFLALLALLFWHLCKAYKMTLGDKHKAEFWIAAGCAGGLTAIYLQSALEWVMRQSINFTEMAICFGVVAAINAARKEDEKQHKQELILARREKVQAQIQARQKALLEGGEKSPEGEEADLQTTGGLS